MMTQALILAAGQGTRLRPLTNDKPKCLVTLLGESLLERQVSVLKQGGVKRIHIATGYCKEQIEALGFETSFNARFADTNMVETLFSAIDFLKQCYTQGEDLIISYGDIVYQIENLHALLESNDEIALMIDKKWEDLWRLRLDNPLDDAETLVMNGDGYITELGKKPRDYERIQGQYTGLIKVRADRIIDFIDFYHQLDHDEIYDSKDFNNMYMTSFLQLLIDSGWKLKAVLVNNGWLEIDSVEDIMLYESMAKQEKLDVFYKVDD